MKKLIQMSETSKCRERLNKYIKGHGIDIGYGGDPIVDWAITIDLPVPYTKVGIQPLNLRGDARSLYWFKDEVLDFVYSAHLLEDFTDTKNVLIEWLRVLKIGGYLILFCPIEHIYRNYCKQTGHARNYEHKKENFDIEYVRNILKEIGVTKIVHVNPLVNIYSFELVAKKIKSLSPFEDSGYKFEIEKLRKALEEKEIMINARINALLNSTSWRITAPLRSLKSIFGRIFYFLIRKYFF